MNDEGDARRCFRMGFSAIPLERIEPGVRALAQCVRSQRPGSLTARERRRAPARRSHLEARMFCALQLEDPFRRSAVFTLRGTRGRTLRIIFPGIGEPQV